MIPGKVKVFKKSIARPQCKLYRFHKCVSLFSSCVINSTISYKLLMKCYLHANFLTFSVASGDMGITLQQVQSVGWQKGQWPASLCILNESNTYRKPGGLVFGRNDANDHVLWHSAWHRNVDDIIFKVQKTRVAWDRCCWVVSFLIFADISLSLLFSIPVCLIKSISKNCQLSYILYSVHFFKKRVSGEQAVEMQAFATVEAGLLGWCSGIFFLSVLPSTEKN